MDVTRADDALSLANGAANGDRPLQGTNCEKMILRGFRYKLDPTPEQEEQFRQFAGVCRAVYNAALEQRRDWWERFERETGKKLNYVAQAKELTALRAEFAWIADVSQTCEQQALRDLDKAFANFFEGVARYPTLRRKGANESFRFQGREIETKGLNRNWSAVRLPKIGWVRFRDTRTGRDAQMRQRRDVDNAARPGVRGTVKNATVTLDALGWHVSFACEIEHEAPANALPAVGVDRGVANTIALSSPLNDKYCDAIAKATRDALERKHRRHQREASRRKRGSKRYAKARRRAAAIKAKAARVRKHFNHTRTTGLVRSFGLVCLEDLNVRNMTASARGTVEEPGSRVRQKAGLNRSILEQGWGQFEIFLAYKLPAAGGRLVKVDPRYTSRKCSNCGSIDARHRESQASFRCVDCGHEAHADVNAAINILRAGTRPSARASARSRESRCAA